jgi:GT2 family glycosyltransferase
VTGEIVVVIVSYETRDRTLRSVESVLGADGVGGYVTRCVVVDNASSDATVEAVRGRHGERVRLVANAANRGYGAACNQGAAACPGARWYVFLNADVELEPGALAVLVAAGDARDAIAIAGPAVVDETGARRDSVRGHPTRLALLHQHTALRFLRVGARAFERYRSPAGARSSAGADVDVVLGAAMLVRGDDFRTLGGFDERYFLYFEEADLCRRAASAGRVVRFVPGATVRHGGGASADFDRERALTWYLASLFRYVDRFCGRGAGLAYRAAFKPLFAVKLATDAVRDAAGAAFGRRGKAAELRTAGRFVRRGLWEFLVA